MADTSLPSSSIVGAGGGGGSSASGTTAEATTTGGDSAATSEFFPGFEPPIEVAGTPQNDVIIGTNDDEHIQGFRGDDVLFGGAGDDQLDGGIGNDRLEGGPGFDFYKGGPGVDVLTFSVADGPANVDLQGSSVVQAGVFESVQEVENVTGSVFGDTLLGDDNNNLLVGGDGLDLLGGRLGDDVLDGGRGGAYASWADQLGAVTADLAAGTASEWDGGHDTLITIIGAVGTAFDDSLSGDDQANRLEGAAGNDVLDGRGGDDVLAGGEGNDNLIGGGGSDSVDYSGAGPVRVNLAAGEGVDATNGVDIISGVENIIGSLGNDVLVGSAGANRMEGGVGADDVTGGSGADTFVFNDRLEFGDTIRDFNSGEDKIELNEATLGQGSASFDAVNNHLLWTPDGIAAPLVVATVLGDSVAAADVMLV